MLTSLIDDSGTPSGEDDVDLLEGFSFENKTYSLFFEGGDTNNNYLVDQGEIWLFENTVNVVLSPGQSLTNNVFVTATYVFGGEDFFFGEDSATVTARPSGGGGGGGTPQPPQPKPPLQLVPTENGKGVTVVGPEGQGLWVELTVVGALASLQNSLNVLRLSGGSTEAVGALGSAPIVPETGVLGGKRYVGTPEKRPAATRRTLEKKAGNTQHESSSMRGLPSHSQLVPVDSTTSPLVHKSEAGCRTRQK